MKKIDIHELMLTKDFEALSLDEQKAVLDKMTAEEYADQRAVLLAFGEMTQEERLPEPDAALLASLRAKHNELHTPTSLWENVIALLTRPLPAYQVVIPTAIALSITIAWSNSENNLAPSPSPLAPMTEVIHDTIEVIQEVPQEIERVVYIDRLETLPTVAETDDGPFESIASTLPDQEELQRSYGNSGVDASILSRLEDIAYREGF